MIAGRFADASTRVAAKCVIGAITLLTLKLASEVLIPLALALLISFMLQPAVRWLRQRGLGNGTSTATVSLVFLLAFSALAWTMFVQAKSLTMELPAYKENLISKLGAIRESTRGGFIGQIKDTMGEVMAGLEQQEAVRLKTGPGISPSTATGDAPQTVVLAEEGTGVLDGLKAAGLLLAPLGTAGLVGLLAILLLLKWADLRARLVALVNQNLTSTTAALDDAGTRVSKYLTLQLMVNLSTGLVIWAGLALIGIPYAGLMGLCAGLFRYVPYAGPVIGAVLPLTITFITTVGWLPLVAVGGLFLVMELVLNNVVEPWLYGSKLGVSEIGIIFASVVWTFLWGPAGLVMATPLTVCMVVLGKNVTGLSFLSQLLSDRVDLPAHTALAQRLMAGDTIEAGDILSTSRETCDAAELYDDVLVPALSSIRHEQRQGRLEPAAATAAVSSLPGIFRELAVEEGCPAAGEAGPVFAFWSLCSMTETLAEMLPARLCDVACRMESFTSQQLATGVVAQLQKTMPLGIALVHLDAADYTRLTATLRRIRRILPGMPVLTGRWGVQPLTAEECRELTVLGATGFIHNPEELKRWLLRQAK